MSTTPTTQAAVELTKPPHPETLPAVQATPIREKGKARPAPRRWSRRQTSPDPWRSIILAALQSPECFICREAKQGLDRYYFWYLEEQYANPTTVERLQRAHGFCLRHAPLLLDGAADPEIRRTVAAALLARVEVDHWEVEEFLRKSSWSQRHELKAAEQDACLRACMRVSGTALEQRHGF